jgi:hypothetical protein
MTTDTPRTDAYNNSLGVVPSDFARQIERELAASKAEVERLRKQLDELHNEVAKLCKALELIAAPKRPDGTYNRCREVCEVLAREALALAPTKCSALNVSYTQHIRQ